MDLTVAAVPFYFGSMEAERRWLARRAETDGPTPADYTRPDTVASLAMGVASLLAPFAAEAIVRRITPGKGRFPKALVRTAVTAAIATTVADRLATLDDDALTQPVPPHGGTGFPPDDERSTLDCLRVLLNEEWAHHRFAVRDLDVLDPPSS